MCQVFSFAVPKQPKRWTELARRGTLSGFLASNRLQNIKTMKGAL